MSKIYSNSPAVSSLNLRKSLITLPESWYAAAGMMARKKKAFVKHGKQVRKEWDSSQ